MKDQYERAVKLHATGGIAEQEYVTSAQNYQSARAKLALAKANVDQARGPGRTGSDPAGPLKVQAPVDGTDAPGERPAGEYVTIFAGQPLILLGNLHPLHVRVNVDEEEIPRLRLYAPAGPSSAATRGRKRFPCPSSAWSPTSCPRPRLTGANTERVDTRVVQVIYAVDPNNRLVQEKKVLVGQLVDVFIDSRPTGQPNK